MPESAPAFLIGCLAISALPPLNGFASEWLTFQTIPVSPQLPQWTLRLLVPTIARCWAGAALAAACFSAPSGFRFWPAALARGGGCHGDRPVLAAAMWPGGVVPAGRHVPVGDDALAR